MAVASVPVVQYPVLTLCDLCEGDVDVNSFCRNCAQNLCDVCKRLHLKSTVSKDHDIVDISQGKKLSDIETSCHEHGQLFLFYCRSCDKLSCPKCLSKYHQNHEFVDTDEYVKEAERAVSELIEEYSIEAERRQREEKEINEAQSKFLELMKTSKNEVHKTTRGMIEEIKQLEARMISNINQRESEGIAACQSEVQHVKAEQKAIEGNLKRLTDETSQHNNVSLIKLSIDMKKKISTLNTKDVVVKIPLLEFHAGRRFRGDVENLIGGLENKPANLVFRNMQARSTKKVHSDFKPKSKLKYWPPQERD